LKYDGEVAAEYIAKLQISWQALLCESNTVPPLYRYGLCLWESYMYRYIGSKGTTSTVTYRHKNWEPTTFKVPAFEQP
jgi:hypothetical protein